MTRDRFTDALKRMRSTDIEWLERAQCRGRDPELYSLDSKLYRDIDRQARARWLCRGCPVMQQCAADALEPLAYGTVRAGVWLPIATSTSGLTPRGWSLIRDGLKAIALGRTDADALALDAVPGRPEVIPGDGRVWGATPPEGGATPPWGGGGPRG